MIDAVGLGQTAIPEWPSFHDMDPFFRPVRSPDERFPSLTLGSQNTAPSLPRLVQCWTTTGALYNFTLEHGYKTIEYVYSVVKRNIVYLDLQYLYIFRRFLLPIPHLDK